MIQLHIKRETGQAANLAKLVVSVFPDRPSLGKVTIDIEVVSKINLDLLIGTDCPSATFDAENQPYTDLEAALISYLGKEYRSIDDWTHVDSTEGETHIVTHAKVKLLPTADVNGIHYRRLQFEPKTAFAPGHTERLLPETSKHPSSKIEGENAIGGWCRIVRDWPERDADGMVEQLGLTITAESTTCLGLYIWYFAPDSYRFESGESQVRVGREHEVGRNVFLFPASSWFTEFSMWNRWINGRAVTRNAKAIGWTSGSCEIVLSARVSSPELRLKARNRSFFFGIALALAMSLIVELGVKLVGTPRFSKHVLFEPAAAVASLFLVGLLIFGYRRRLV